MEWMYFVRPALTVVAQPTYDLGRTAVELLLQRMEDPDRPYQEVAGGRACTYANRAVDVWPHDRREISWEWARKGEHHQPNADA